MAVPDYQSFMLPLLRLFQDSNANSLNSAYEALAAELNLSEADRQQLLPSGQQKTYQNRIGWAATHLKKAALLTNPARGKLQITSLGLEILQQNPDKITSKFLRQFPDYLTFLGHAASSQQQETKSPELTAPENSQTPEELLQTAYQTLKSEVAAELLQLLKSSSPGFFERVVVDLLVAMGYGGSRKAAGKAIGRSGDGGIDGIISEDPLGLDNIYIQAKRWEGNVGRPMVQAFAGSLEGFRARKGVMITTADFSKDAKDYVTRIEKKIVLISGEMLAELMVENNVGVTERERFVVKRIDIDYFEESE
jgi:restriction system protein